MTTSMNAAVDLRKAEHAECTEEDRPSGVATCSAKESAASPEHCSVEGCFHVVRNMKLSLCSKHYQRHLRYGDTSFTKTVRFVPPFRGKPQP